ncbi:hypothetical protein BGX34_000614 [Mortierella sp. NVP85]|nr:hypothetical protein BGX34_000614 [Mortierella sp. NVP85]
MRGTSEAFLASKWRCGLTPSWLFKGQVHISLGMLDSSIGQGLPEFEFIHCIPLNPTNEADPKVFRVTDHDGSKGPHGSKPFMKGGDCRFSVPEEFIVDKNDPQKICFDLVLSTTETLPAVLVVSEGSSAIPERKGPSPVSKSFKEMFPERYQDMLNLLKDPGSVNIAFLFTIYNCQRKVALWANRTILDKHLRLQELLGTADHTPAMIPIQGISLTTFCVLLKYLYTGDLGLDVDPSQFLMCDMDQLKDDPFMNLIGSTAVLNKSLEEYNAAQFYATWNVKDKVTWSDLFLAADRFEITELREQCLDNLLASVNENNAMEILFGVGTCFRDEVYNPIMKYILSHLGDTFAIQTQDPFKRFADHAQCHEVMLELLRLSHSKDSK